MAMERRMVFQMVRRESFETLVGGLCLQEVALGDVHFGVVDEESLLSRAGSGKPKITKVIYFGHGHWHQH